MRGDFHLEQENIEKKIIEIIKKQMNLKEKPLEFCLQEALALAEKAKYKAKEIGVPIVFSAVDKGGNLLLLQRMEGALLASIDISINKAYTANAFQMPTSELAQQALQGNPLYGIQNTNQGKVVIFGGGYPYYKNGMLAGAIGVSGGTVEEDMMIAEFSLK